MSFKFPYTNFQELNLDWIIKKVKDLSKQIESDSSIVAEYIDRLLVVEEKADNADATATAADARATGANNTANSALTLATQAKQTADIADLQTTLLDLKIGNLSSLFTTAKDTIVNAINEVWSIFHNATAVTNVTPAGTDPAVTYSNGVFTFDLPEGGDPDAVTHTELDAALDELSEEITEELDNKADVIIDTASGDLVGFPDGTATPLKSLVVNIEPKQAGSGDPSPSNVRPLSGWTGCEVWRDGANLIPTINVSTPQTSSGVTLTIGDDGALVLNETATGVGTFVLAGTSPFNQTLFTIKKGTYNLSIGESISQTCSFSLYDWVSGRSMSVNGSQGNKTQTLTEDLNVTYIRLQTYSGTYNNTKLYPMLSVGETAQPYEPHNGNSYSVTFGETVYGGSMDVVSGVKIVDRAIITPNVNSISAPNSYGIVNCHFTINNQGVRSGDPKIRLAISNVLSVQNTLFADTTNVGFMIANENDAYLRLKSSDISDVASANAWVANNSCRIVFYLGTPIETRETPTPITALKGYNAVWSDAGAVDVTYRADTKGYIDKLIAQVQALALGG